MKPVILGLDLSLTCTGLAGDGWAQRLESKGRLGADYNSRSWRMKRLAGQILDVIRSASPVLVVIEAPSFSRKPFVSPISDHVNAGFWWSVVHSLLAEFRVAFVSPTGLKAYATGKGNAKKADVIAAVKDLFAGDFSPSDDNEADAMVLCAMGYDRAGYPLVEVGPKQRKALENVEWP